MATYNDDVFGELIPDAAHKRDKGLRVAVGDIQADKPDGRQGVQDRLELRHVVLAAAAADRHVLRKARE
jgi:hypothetical protein